MSPLSKTTLTSENETPVSPFVGPIDLTHTVDMDITALTSDEVDADGYLKAGIPVDAAGALVGVATAVFGVTIEPLKVADGNAAGDLAAAPASIDIAVATHANINRAIGEDLLGRVYTADEIAGFALAGSTCKLLE